MVDAEKQKVKDIIIQSPHVDPIPFPPALVHKNIASDFESKNVISLIFEKWFNSIINAYLEDQSQTEAVINSNSFTPTSTDILPPAPDLSIQDKQRHFHNILTQAELVSTLPPKKNGDKKNDAERERCM